MHDRRSRKAPHLDSIGIILGGILWVVLWPVSATAQQQTPAALPGQATPTTPQSQAPVSGGIRSERQFVEVRAFTNLSRITGEARDRSFLTDGNNSAVDFSYLEDFSFGVRQLEAASVLRYTDDRRVDPERNSVQRAYLRISSPRSEYNFGDYLVNYSRLTYNQNLKGLHFMRTAPVGHGFRLMGNVGVFTDRYGSLFKEELPGKPFTRVVSGLRAEQKVDTDKTLALTWAFGNDMKGSIPVDPVTGTVPFVPVANSVVSLDARMVFARIWDMQAEAAYSYTDPDTRFASGTRKDYALRFDNSIRSGRWSASFFYTRIMPSFAAINARQVADLQDAMIRAGVDLSDQVYVQGIYRRTNNDLRGESGIPKDVFQMPEVRLSFRNLPGLGSALLDVGYRERRLDRFEQVDLADRVTRTPFFEISIPISSSVLGFGYEHRNLTDEMDPSNETVANDFSVSFRSYFDLGNWAFSPVLRYQHNRETFDRVDTGNNNRNIRAAVIVDAPRYFEFEGMFRQVGATLFQEVLDPDTQELKIGPAGFRRPSFRLALTYKLFNDENRRITFSYERNNNMFALPGQDFLERVMQVAVTWRFQRQ